MNAALNAEWSLRCGEHCQALERVLVGIERLDEVAWLRRPAPDKWCPGQVAEHLVLSYDALLRELAGEAGMRVRPSWWKRRLLRLRFLPMLLKEGRLPSGAPAVRELRPGEQPRSRQALLETLRERARRFELELTRAFEAGAGRLTHPYFGRCRRRTR